MRFKHDINPFTASVLNAVDLIHVKTFIYNDALTNKDNNERLTKLGIIAEDVRKFFPICTVYERDLKTPKSWDDRCMIAVLFKAVQEQQAEIAMLKNQRRVQ
jgi:hypothetical protein